MKGIRVVSLPRWEIPHQVRDDEQERTFPQQEITDDDCRYSKPASPLGSLRDRAGRIKKSVPTTGDHRR